MFYSLGTWFIVSAVSMDEPLVLSGASMDDPSFVSPSSEDDPPPQEQEQCVEIQEIVITDQDAVVGIWNLIYSIDELTG